MRILLKILLFPVTLALTILVLVCRFFCNFSSVILGIISFVLFALGLGIVIILQDPPGSLTAFIIAYLISPYGIPKFAEWLIDRLDDLNCAIKSI